MKVRQACIGNARLACFTPILRDRCPVGPLSALFLCLCTTQVWGQEGTTKIKASGKIYAQTLVDLVIANPDHPGVVLCSMHVTAPGATLPTTRNIASSDINELGKLAGDEEFGVITTGNPNFYRKKDQSLYKGIVPLKDISGQQIGALTLAFKYTKKEDEEKFVGTMRRIRNELKLLIPSRAELFTAARTPTKIYAQTLVDQLMEKNPKLRRCAMHVTYPGVPESNNYVIAFSDIDGPVKPGGGGDATANVLDEDTMVNAFGRDYFYLKENTPFSETPAYKGMLSLHDMTGQQIGMIIFAWTWTNRAEEPKIEETMLALRDDLKKLIPNTAALFKQTDIKLNGIFQDSIRVRPVVAAPRPAPLISRATIALPKSSEEFGFLKADLARRRLIASQVDNGTADLIDLDTGRLITSTKLGPAVDLTIDPKTGKYFVSLRDEKRVAVVDSGSLKETNSIPVEGLTDAIVCDPKNRRVYVAHADAKELWMIDADSEKVVGTLPLPGVPADMVYDATTNRIYLTLYDTSEVAAIDPDKNAVVARWSTNPARSPRGLALDSRNRRLFVAGAYLAVVDIKSGKVISSADITENVESVAFDPVSRRIYCSGPVAITVLQANQDGVMFVGTTGTEGTKNIIVDPKSQSVWTISSDGKKVVATSWVLP